MVLRELGNKISKAFQNLKKNLTIDDEAIKLMLKDITEALKDSDVHYDLIKKVEKNLRKKLLGDELQKYAHKQSVIRHCVFEEIRKLLDSKSEPYKIKKGKTNILMFVGLQGKV